MQYFEGWTHLINAWTVNTVLNTQCCLKSWKWNMLLLPIKLFFSLKMLNTPKRQKKLGRWSGRCGSWPSNLVVLHLVFKLPLQFPDKQKEHIHLSNLSYIYICVWVSHDIISSYPINSPIYIPMKPGQWLQPVAPQLGSQFKAQDLNWSRVGHRGKNNGDEKHGKMLEKSGNIYGKLHIMVKKTWQTMARPAEKWEEQEQQESWENHIFFGITYRKHLETDKQRLGIRKNCFFCSCLQELLCACYRLKKLRAKNLIEHWNYGNKSGNWRACNTFKSIWGWNRKKQINTANSIQHQSQQHPACPNRWW